MGNPPFENVFPIKNGGLKSFLALHLFQQSFAKDGFIWRSRLSTHGMRRVNYYIKYLIQDEIAMIWSNHSDLTRPQPKWWFSKGNLLFQENPGW